MERKTREGSRQTACALMPCREREGEREREMSQVSTRGEDLRHLVDFSSYSC